MSFILNGKEKFLLILHLLLVLILAVLQTVYPVFVSSFLNQKNELIFILYALTFLILGKVIIHILDILLSNMLYWNVFSKLRMKLVEVLITMDYSDIVKKDIGELTQTVENDSEQLIQFYMVFLTILIKNVLIVFGVLCVGMATGIWIGGLLCFVIIALFFVFRFINQLAKKRWKDTKNEYQNFFYVFSKSIEMMDEMNLLHNDVFLKRNFINAMNKVFNAEFMSSLISYDLWLSTIFGFGLIRIIILISGVVLHLNPGVVYLFIYYIDMLNDPIEELRIQLENIPSTMESSFRVERLLNCATKMKYGDKMLNDKIQKIEFEGVSFGYNRGYVFKNLNLSFESGKVYAIIGQSGSGKSTLINLIARLMDVKEGTIKVNGIPISYFQKGELNKQMEYIGQNEETRVSKMEIVDPYNQKSKKEIEDFIGFSLDKDISMGQHQYLYLCRALLSDKSLLMLDEVFTHIDKAKAENAFRKFSKKNQIILIITHEKEIMQYCDEIINLEDITYAYSNT